MVAEAPDKVEGNAYELHLKTTAAQSHALNFSGNEYVPKARKPYIITKQREKWTDDEHQKFLEALKLHGRAWRQIEEYVGTKTTIQIRSHAQKYFNKVGRENLGSSEGSLDVFVIPPPRPKKKPLHPYPRKVVNPIKRVEMKATSPPRDVIGVERSRLSPTSCTTDDVLLMENDNECLTSNNNTSVEEEKRSLESVQATNNKLFTKAEMLTLGGPYSLDNPPETEECSTTIRLFGRTLKVNDSQKLSSSSTAEDTEIHLKDAAAEEEEEEELKVENSPIIPDKEPKYAFGFIQGNFTALSCFVPPQYGMNKECSDAGLVSGGIPWWGVCQGMVFPQVSSMAAADSVVESPSCDKRDQETEPRKEGPINNSNGGSEANELKTKSNDIESKARSKTLKKRSSAKKGFVPYKRCLTERDAPSPIVSAEERKKQKARVCS